jgi:hypothetical protein
LSAKIIRADKAILRERNFKNGGMMPWRVLKIAKMLIPL